MDFSAGVRMVGGVQTRCRCRRDEDPPCLARLPRSVPRLGLPHDAAASGACADARPLALQARPPRRGRTTRPTRLRTRRARRRQHPDALAAGAGTRRQPPRPAQPRRAARPRGRRGQRTNRRAQLEGDALSDLAEVLHAAGRTDEAVAVLDQALDRYDRKRNLAQAAETRDRLVALRGGAPL